MRKRILLLIISISAISIATNCNLPETELHVASGNFMTHVTEINFVDDTSNESINREFTALDGLNTTVRIEGPDADKIYNIEGKKQFKIDNGSLLLLLDPNVRFSSDETTFTANVIIECPGFLKRNIPVTFYKDDNDGYIEVAMIKTSNPPIGVAVAEKTGTLTDGGLADEIHLKADNSSNKGVTTEVVIPQGIKMFSTDKNGNKIALTGTVQTQVVSFTETGDGTSYFPGGLTPSNINISKDRPSESGAFVSAGFAAIQMTVNGRTVTTFEDKQISVKMFLGELNYNPKTGTSYQEGDSIDIWSYENENGQWKFEQTGIVLKDNNNLYVSFATSHLSFFNLDYLESGNKGRCYSSSIKINWTGVDRLKPIRCRFTFRYIGSATSSWRQTVISKVDYIFDESIATLKNAPQLPIEIEVYDLDNSINLGKYQFKYGEICNGASITITQPAPTNKYITLKYRGLCSGTIISPPIGTRVYYKKSNETSWKLLYYVNYAKRLDDRLVTNLLQINNTYDIKVYAGGKTAQKQITIKQEVNDFVFEIPENICKSLTGF